MAFDGGNGTGGEPADGLPEITTPGLKSVGLLWLGPGSAVICGPRQMGGAVGIRYVPAGCPGKTVRTNVALCTP